VHAHARGRPGETALQQPRTKPIARRVAAAFVLLLTLVLVALLALSLLDALAGWMSDHPIAPPPASVPGIVAPPEQGPARQLMRI
jgi:hypothetical protein